MVKTLGVGTQEEIRKWGCVPEWIIASQYPPLSFPFLGPNQILPNPYNVLLHQKSTATRKSHHRLEPPKL
jgi:hypothetical protein